MTIIDLLTQYSEGKREAIQVIRDMSGMFDPKHAVTLLTYVCAVTRVEQGDLDMECFREVYLKIEKPKYEQHADGVKEI
jgi:hypothetical protein